MAQVYSEICYEGHDLGGWNYCYLDPAFIWVVRDIVWFFAGPAAQATMHVVASEVGCTIASDAQLAVNNPGYASHWEGRQVFVPPATGPTLSIYGDSSVGAGVDVRICGYRLTPP